MAISIPEQRRVIVPSQPALMSFGASQLSVQFLVVRVQLHQAVYVSRHLPADMLYRVCAVSTSKDSDFPILTIAAIVDLLLYDLSISRSLDAKFKKIQDKEALTGGIQQIVPQ